MHRVSKAVAVTSLLIALTTSNIYVVPSKGGTQPTLGSRIVKIIRQIVGLDLGDMSVPHP
jgi:hypothetical protein